MKLYVGNLAYSVRDEDLKEAFGVFGAVSDCVVISDRDTGRSKGFGFVQMDNDAEAAAAIESMNGAEFGGRKMVVNEARPREERSGGGGGGRYGGGYGGGGGRDRGGYGNRGGGRDRGRGGGGGRDW